MDTVGNVPVNTLHRRLLPQLLAAALLTVSVGGCVIDPAPVYVGPRYVGPPVYAAPRYYAPEPVYAPPRYYAPAPVYVAPPPVIIGGWFGHSSGGWHHGPPHRW